MDSLARKIGYSEVVQEMGTVKRAEGAVFVIVTDAGAIRARRATSCLVAPEADDLVLLATAADGRSYVLSVLERKEGARTSITVDGDLQLRVPHGRFGVAAQEGVELCSAKETKIVTGSLDVHALDGSVVLERLTFLGTFVQAELAKVKLLAGTFDSVVERISQRVKRSYRTVEETDQVRAEQIDYVAKSTMSLRGENTLVTAKELVKVDGEQIHLG